MSAMLGVIKPSLAGRLTMVLRQEDADRHRSQHQTAAQRPPSEGSPEAEGVDASRPFTTPFSGVGLSLGGLRRSFAASPWCKLPFRFRQTLTTEKRRWHRTT